MPPGASGSSAISARLFVSSGVPLHSRSGETFRPSHVYFFGIGCPSRNAFEVSRSAMIRSSVDCNPIRSPSFASPTGQNLRRPPGNLAVLQDSRLVAPPFCYRRSVMMYATKQFERGPRHADVALAFTPAPSFPACAPLAVPFRRAVTALSFDPRNLSSVCYPHPLPGNGCSEDSCFGSFKACETLCVLDWRRAGAASKGGTLNRPLHILSHRKQRPSRCKGGTSRHVRLAIFSSFRGLPQTGYPRASRQNFRTDSLCLCLTIRRLCPK